MNYYKILQGNYVESVLETRSQGYKVQIGVLEYNNILNIFSTKPAAPSGYTYMLRSDTLEWELVENSPEPEPPVDDDIDDAEALSILLGGAE